MSHLEQTPCIPLSTWMAATAAIETIVPETAPRTRSRRIHCGASLQNPLRPRAEKPHHSRLIRLQSRRHWLKAARLPLRRATVSVCDSVRLEHATTQRRINNSTECDDRSSRSHPTRPVPRLICHPYPGSGSLTGFPLHLAAHNPSIHKPEEMLTNCGRLIAGVRDMQRGHLLGAVHRS